VFRLPPRSPVEPPIAPVGALVVALVCAQDDLQQPRSPDEPEKPRQGAAARNDTGAELRPVDRGAVRARSSQVSNQDGMPVGPGSDGVSATRPMSYGPRKWSAMALRLCRRAMYQSLNEAPTNERTAARHD
jgi:hypothetical protein